MSKVPDMPTELAQQMLDAIDAIEDAELALEKARKHYKVVMDLVFQFWKANR